MNKPTTLELGTAMEFDVFISFKNLDSDGNVTRDKQLADAIYQTLTQQGMQVFYSNVTLEQVGNPQFMEETFKALDSSKVLVVVGTKKEHFVHKWVKKEWLTFCYLDTSNVNFDRKIFVYCENKDNVAIKDVPLLLRSNSVVYHEDGLGVEKLCRSIENTLDRASGTTSSHIVTTSSVISTSQKQTKRYVIIYRRSGADDNMLAHVLAEKLTDQGHSVFFDRQLPMGVPWAKVIEQEIQDADGVVVLLSEHGIGSEMLPLEVKMAFDAQLISAGGAPVLLPVRLRYEGSLPETLDKYLHGLQYTMWNGIEDTSYVVDELVNSLTKQKTSPKEKVLPLDRLLAAGESNDRRPVGGRVPVNSPFYVERSVDHQFIHALRNERTMFYRIKGASQIGKTSLIARGIQFICENKSNIVVLTDLQTLTREELDTPLLLFTALGRQLQNALRVETSYEDYFANSVPRGKPGHKFQNYLLDVILPAVDGRLFWVIDEVDQLFNTYYYGDVFSMMRTWHNMNSSASLWSKLTIILGYSTEVSLFIPDALQSPFNVGVAFELQEFNQQEIRALNELYNNPIRTAQELEQLYQLLGGKPHLIRRCLYQLSTPFPNSPAQTFLEWNQTADKEDGPLGDHLRKILILVTEDETFQQTIIEILQGKQCSNLRALTKLQSVGIVGSGSPKTARIKNILYDRYLRRMMGVDEVKVESGNIKNSYFRQAIDFLRRIFK